MKTSLPTFAISALASLAVLGKDFVGNVAEFAFGETAHCKSPELPQPTKFVTIPKLRRQSRVLRCVERSRLRQERARFFREISTERPDLNRATRRALAKQVRFV